MHKLVTLEEFFGMNYEAVLANNIMSPILASFSMPKRRKISNPTSSELSITSFSSSPHSSSSSTTTTTTTSSSSASTSTLIQTNNAITTLQSLPNYKSDKNKEDTTP